MWPDKLSSSLNMLLTMAKQSSEPLSVKPTSRRLHSLSAFVQSYSGALRSETHQLDLICVLPVHCHDHFQAAELSG